MRVGGQHHAPANLSPATRPATPCSGGCVDNKASLNGYEKLSSPPGFDPRTVQPVACSYINQAIPVHVSDGSRNINIDTTPLSFLRNTWLSETKRLWWRLQARCSAYQSFLHYVCNDIA
jgi:hypothetical protein